jgi:hypothetical protein
MAQAVSRRLTVPWLKRLVAANVQSQANPNHRIYGVRDDSAAVFSPRSSVFSCQYHFTISPYPYFDMYYRRSETFARDDVVKQIVSLSLSLLVISKPPNLFATSCFLPQSKRHTNRNTNKQTPLAGTAVFL